MVAQEEAGELKDAIIFFGRNAWLLKSSGANFRNHRDETLRNITRLIVLSLMRSFPSLIFPDPMREMPAMLNAATESTSIQSSDPNEV